MGRCKGLVVGGMALDWHGRWRSSNLTTPASQCHCTLVPRPAWWERAVLRAAAPARRTPYLSVGYAAIWPATAIGVNDRRRRWLATPVAPSRGRTSIMELDRGVEWD